MVNVDGTLGRLAVVSMSQSLRAQQSVIAERELLAVDSSLSQCRAACGTIQITKSINGSTGHRHILRYTAAFKVNDVGAATITTIDNIVNGQVRNVILLAIAAEQRTFSLLNDEVLQLYVVDRGQEVVGVRITCGIQFVSLNK